MTAQSRHTVRCDRCNAEEDYRPGHEKLPRGWAPLGLGKHLCSDCADDRRSTMADFMANRAFTVNARARPSR